MHREYHKWFSPSLGREMEMLVHGHGGLPAVVFPSSQGRFFEFEDRGMVGAVGDKIERGELQLFCVDSVDAESWYNRDVPARWRVARQMQYENYVMGEVLPLLRRMNWNPLRIAMGCSFGGYHAATMSFRHPDVFTGFLAMSGAFDVSNFLRGYYDEDAYMNLPTHFLRQLNDPWYFERYRRNSYVLATGDWDICRGANEELAGLLRWKEIPVRFDIWGEQQMHDWPLWQRMVREYL